MIGFVMAFPSVAVQMFLMDKISPVHTAITYGVVSFPWCLKPLYGFVSDKYPVFDMGRRKPYIAWASLMLGFLYTFAFDFKDDIIAFVSFLTFISLYVCIVDVCSDGITISYAKIETKKGITQTNTWICRSTGTLIGFVFGGMLYKATDTKTVLNFTAILPMINTLIIWNIPERKLENKPVYLRTLWDNFVKQRYFVLILFIFHITPNYGVFYQYFLKEELKYNSDQFTYLSIASSLSFLIGLICFKYYFRKIKLNRLLLGAVVCSSIIRLSQLLVIFKIIPDFWLVAVDGVTESFFGQLVMMPLIVVAGKVCDDGLEGSFFSFVMAVMNFGTFLADESGGAIAYWLGVTRTSFDNLYILMLIGMASDVIIPFMLIKKMSFYFELESVASVLPKKNPQDQMFSIDSDDE